MKLVGFNFEKISIEKLSELTGKLSIKTDIDIKEIKEIKTNMLKTKEIILNIKFQYGIDYTPGIAKLDFKGSILVAAEGKQAKEILKEWKNKKISDEFRIIIFNLILSKASIKALQLEENMNLPPHLPLPKLKGEEKK